jgi:CelD/BcsL family acetyltransferase involved in cellulose biosynthesis
MTCDIELLSSLDRLTSIRDEWEQLLSDSDSTVFQSYEWISTWWEHHQDGRKLRIFVLRNSGLVVGIAPFFLEKRRLPWPFGIRHLKYLGSPLSDYQHVISRRGNEELVANDLCQYLVEHCREWDVLDMESVNEESGDFSTLRAALKRNNLSDYLYQGSVSARLRLPHTFEEYLQSGDKHWRHEYRRKLKALTKMQDVKVEEFRDPGETLQSAMVSCFDIHGSRWKSLGYPSAFDKEDVRKFYCAIADRFAARGMLRLTFLAVNGVRVTFSLDLSYGGTVYVLHSQAVGSDDIMKCSPGFLIKMRAIETAIAEHQSMYDLLRGEYDYKYRDFAASPSKNWMIRATSVGRGVKVRFAFYLLTEFVEKAFQRAQREYYESRRYRMTRDSSPLGLIRYVFQRIGALAHIAKGYIVRHSGAGPGQDESQNPPPPSEKPATMTKAKKRRTGGGLRDFPVGTTVRVKSEAEILATLDNRQMLQNLPFMPEMRRYCGKEFEISGWAHKGCVEGYGLRKLDSTVFLGDLRCDGSAHDGCQRACLLFWKTDWVEHIHSGQIDRSSESISTANASPVNYLTKQGQRYVCQSTELYAATAPMPWWDLTQYVKDLHAGKISWRLGVRAASVLVVGKVKSLVGGRSHSGLRGSRLKTPRETIGLTPGETVRVKSRDEIVATLDSEGRNRGLEFSPEMTAFCGRSLRTQERVTTIILEQTGERREISDTVILEGSYCDGLERRLCPRKNLFLWREIWLEREGTGTPKPGGDEPIQKRSE